MLTQKISALLLFTLTAGVHAEPNIFMSSDSEPIISAHRSGAGIAPEETIKALDVITANDQTRVGLIETDVHLTRDGKLVHLHDDTLDRTSNAQEFFRAATVPAAAKTYAQLRQLNMGENFQDPDGSYPYRGLRGKDIPDNIRILELNDFLDYVSKQAYPYLLTAEIKNRFFSGFKAADGLYLALKQHNMLENTVIASFNQEVLWYLDRYPDVKRSAGPLEILDFYVKSALNLPLGNVRYQALQIPYYPVLRVLFGFGTPRFNAYARSNGIATHYWTVNNAADILYLSQNGADSVMTDYPDLATAIIYNPNNFLENYLADSLLTAPLYYGSLITNQLELNRQTENTIFRHLIAGWRQAAPVKAHWSMFLDYNFANQYGGKNRDGGQDLSQTLNMGFLYRTPAHLMLGGMLTAGNNKREPHPNYHFTEKPFNLTLFAYQTLSDHLWLAGILSWGQTKLSTVTRTAAIKGIDFVSVIPAQKTRTFTGAISLGYHLNLNPTMLFTPYLTYSYEQVKSPAAGERGQYFAAPLNLNYQKINLNNTRLQAGTVLTKTGRTVNYMLLLNYNYRPGTKTAAVKFNSAPTGNVFTAAVPVGTEKWLELGGGIDFKLTAQSTLALNLNFKKAPQTKINTLLNIGFNHDFR